jgi:DNA (cytosine-5)-methyltransferase 1
MNPIRELSLFSGVAGFTVGLHKAGDFEPVAFCEKDKYCQVVLRSHYPDIPIFKDVRDVTAAAVSPLGRIDIITGGFPCQDISVAGGRAGLSGERSGLWFEFHRVIMDIRPEWFIIENVDALLTSGPVVDVGGKRVRRKGIDFAIILAGLTGVIPRIPDDGWRSSGFVAGLYGVAWRVFDSRYFGVAQRRKRVFLVGHLGDERALEVLFESGGGKGGFAPSRGKRKRASSPLKAAAPSRRNGGSNPVPNDFVGWWNGSDVADTLDVSSLVKGQMMPERNRFPVVFDGANITSKTNRSNPEPDEAFSIHSKMSESILAITDRADTVDEDINSPLRASDGGGQQNIIAFSAKDYGNGAVEGISPTLQESGDGQVAIVEWQLGHGDVREYTDVAPTLFADQETGGPHVPMVLNNDVPVVVPALQADGAGTMRTGNERTETEFLVYPTLDEATQGKNAGNNQWVDNGFAIPNHKRLRRLMPVECERLQGFPSGWCSTKVSDTQAYRQMGNAVTTTVITAIGFRLKKVHKRIHG